HNQYLSQSNMSSIKNLIQHTFKATSLPGWSTISMEAIDVSNIVSITCGKRLFRIFNWNHPYNLVITYHNPEQRADFAKISSINDYIGRVILHRSKYLMTRRYASEQDCVDDINSIKAKQEKLYDYMNEKIDFGLQKNISFI